MPVGQCAFCFLSACRRTHSASESEKAPLPFVNGMDAPAPSSSLVWMKGAKASTPAKNECTHVQFGSFGLAVRRAMGRVGRWANVRDG